MRYQYFASLKRFSNSRNRGQSILFLYAILNYYQRIRKVKNMLSRISLRLLTHIIFALAIGMKIQEVIKS